MSDRPTNQPTNQPTNATDRPGCRKAYTSENGLSKAGAGKPEAKLLVDDGSFNQEPTIVLGANNNNYTITLACVSIAFVYAYVHVCVCLYVRDNGAGCECLYVRY